MANPIRFNVDLTGINPNNRVEGEMHSLPIKQNRSVATTYGPYYTESLEVYDATTNNKLTRDVHYKCLDVVGLPTAQSGKEICTVLVITNPSVSNTIRLNYQALGGGYEHTFEAIKLLLDNLLSDTRPISWPNILNRPTVFEPSNHLHRVGDVIGFEYMVVELERLKSSILLGDEIAHMEILTYIDISIAGLKQLVDDSQNTVTILAVTAATDANNSANLALQQVAQLSAEISIINSALNQGLSNIQDLIDSQATSEARAIALIEQYS
jgi:hypothetical protein